MALAPGTVLGRYRLLERVGAGGMSEVFAAEDSVLHRRVAVKVMHGPIAQDPSFVERFLREARLVAGLEHPNVLPVYDFGAARVGGEEVSFLVMPLVPGGTLRRGMQAASPQIAISWLSAIGEALDHAHSRGILHRDIKPGNVLLDSTGRPLLADFGLARSASAASGLTATGTVMGTPLYMAPEQAMGRPLDATADQYALAVMGFEMLTGRVPFIGDSPLAILHQHVHEMPPPVTSLAPGLPKAVDAVLARALAKEPAARFASCRAFVGALAGALGVPLSAPTAVYAGEPLAPAPTAPVLPASDVSQAATVVTERRSGPPASLTAPPSGAQSGPPRALLAGGIAAVVVAGGLGVYLLNRPGGSPAPVPVASVPTPASSAVTVAEPPAPTPAGGSEPAQAPQPTEPPVSIETAAPKPEPTEPKTPKAPPAPVPAKATPQPAKLELLPREPLLPRTMSSDTTLAHAAAALDHTRKPGGRLRREDFVEAMGRVESQRGRQSASGRLLYSFSRAAVAFADGKDAEAWQLLERGFGTAQPHGRTLRFVGEEVSGHGRNPGPDRAWILGLAFADVRGDLDEELQKAEERAPDSPNVAYARALHAWSRGQAAEARRYARKACDGGVDEACGLK